MQKISIDVAENIKNNSLQQWKILAKVHEIHFVMYKTNVSCGFTFIHLMIVKIDIIFFSPLS